MEFPLERSYLDYAGKTRRFSIHRNQNPSWPGCILEAQEMVNGQPAGYHFEVSSDADNPVAALGLLHSKIQAGLSRRYAYTKGDNVTMLGDTLKGRITHDRLIVDGEPISYDQLIDLFSMHEGFDFEMKFVDSCAP